MSGGSAPYHLRLNKSIERNLFIDLLKIVGRHTNISDYWYIGFAGPFSEDFKTIHGALRITKMKSVEYDENVFKRQKFNYSPDFIEYQLCSFREFLDTDFYQLNRGSTNTISWLDYADARKTKVQIQEFQKLVGQSIPNDVIKLTLNANPSTLKGETPEDKLQCFKHRLGDFCPQNINVDDLLSADYPNTLMRCIKLSLDKISTTQQRYFHPLSSFVYSDTNNQMLTLTGIILANDDEETIKAFETASRVSFWKFCNTTWTNPLKIRVPSLSIKERIALDSKLPCEGKERGTKLMESLEFHPEDDETKGILALENYADYYRAYSLFTKVVV